MHNRIAPIYLLVTLATLVSALPAQTPKAGVTQAPYGKTPPGEVVTLYTLDSNSANDSFGTSVGKADDVGSGVWSPCAPRAAKARLAVGRVAGRTGAFAGAVRGDAASQSSADGAVRFRRHRLGRCRRGRGSGPGGARLRWPDPDPSE